ncbi:MAG: YCF48-related protein [Pirellulales bacterium]
MIGHGRSWLSGWMLLCAVQAATAFGQTPAEPASVGPALHDAQLADVCFVDAQKGWAVGDRGVIWYTSDGGTQWQLQSSGVDCRLDAVWFIDAENGWAAGGSAHPYTSTTSGVLLRTRDGGQHWTRIGNLVLPALKGIKFFDLGRGWAIAKPSSLFPSGVFTTDDGGRSWTSLPPAETPGWLAGDFISTTSGAVAGPGGSFAAILRGNWAQSQSAGLGLASIRKMKFATGTVAWMVGDGATVLVSGDAGLSWGLPPTKIPAAMTEFDFAALAVRGRQCWIAGSPGTKVLHSPDGGQTWTAYPTGQTLPLSALAFADDKNGWAVGALGTILATGDGGRTWQRQQAGGVRTAILGIYGEAADVPWELSARLSGNDGYLAAVEILGRRDIESPRVEDIDMPERVHEAVIAVGGSDARTAWAFPLRQAGLGLSAEQTIAPWDRAGGGAGLKRLEAHVVRQIRVWRPDIVFTHGVGAEADDPLARIVQQAVLRAVQEAAQPTGFPEQIASTGLAPWRVKKVYGGMPPGRSATVNLATSQLAPRLGRTLAEHAAASHGLVADSLTAAPETLGFRLLVADATDESAQRDFLAGIAIQPGDGARRAAAETSPEGVHTLERTAQKARIVQAILERANRDTGAGASWLAQFDELTRGLDAASVAPILFQMGHRYHETGRWELAAETFEL